MMTSTNELQFRPTANNAQQTKTTTQSQIITNLNFSIEDLLSKISKVTNDYPYAVAVPQMENKTERYMSYQKVAQKSYQDTLEPSLQKESLQPKFQFSHTSTSGSEAEIPSQELKQFDRNSNVFPFRTNFPSKTQHFERPKWESHKRNNTISATLIKELPQQLKFNKINSLFDDYSIKEVAESTIFNQQAHGQGSFKELQRSIGSLKQSVLHSQHSQSPPRYSEPSEIKLSDFQLGKEVGSGKFGDVYLCKHKATGMIFALKKIFKSVIQEYKMEAQFTLQLKILYALDHPNIVKLYTHFCDDYHIFLLMEYIEGGQFMTRIGKPQKYISPMIEQVIDAVEYLHSKGIVHRDIKPQNIVVSFQHTAKLCDFGWAGLYDHKSMKTTFCGTLDYVSPEMKDKGSYSREVDIWSIGVLAFQMLTGNAPFKNEIAHWKMKGAQRSNQWDWNIIYPPSLSGLAESFMRNLLKQNPDERASLRYCKNHFFIKKHHNSASQYEEFYYIL